MERVALKMLTGDRVKYVGLVLGIAFATLLITQQVTIFAGLLTWGANPILDVREADVWVMDDRVEQPNQNQPLPDQALYRVRSVQGVAWAVPHFRSQAAITTREGALAAVQVIGVDNQSFVGLPLAGRDAAIAALSGRNAAVLDSNTQNLIWPDGRDPIGQVAEINDNRIVVRGLTSALTTFAGLPTVYLKYSDAIALTPPERNKLSFVLVRAAPGVAPSELAGRITAQTGLKALPRESFAASGVRFIIENTGIPVSFGVAIALGVVVAVVITGLTLAMFVAENLKTFGALKAIGVTNKQIVRMVLTQALVVGCIGYGLGVGGTAAFVFFGGGSSGLQGFTLRADVLIGAAGLVALIMIGSALVSVGRVLRLDPAVVFRG